MDAPPSKLPALRKDYFGLSSPIGVIGGFTALSEIAMVIAAVQTEGGVQVLISLFAVLFPIGIASAFFYVLWHRPEVLYPPREYGTTSVSDYAAAMRQRSIALSEEKQATVIVTAVQNAVKEAGPELVKALAENSGTPNVTAHEQITIETVEQVVERVLDTAAHNAAERIRDDLYIEIVAPFTVQGTDAAVTELIPVDEFTTIDDLIVRAIGVSSMGILLPAEFSKEYFDYGIGWALAEESGVIYDKMGPMWQLAHGPDARSHSDTRPISSLGIRPGMRLTKVVLENAFR